METLLKTLTGMSRILDFYFQAINLHTSVEKMSNFYTQTEKKEFSESTFTKCHSLRRSQGFKNRLLSLAQSSSLSPHTPPINMTFSEPLIR